MLSFSLFTGLKPVVNICHSYGIPHIFLVKYSIIIPEKVGIPILIIPTKAGIPILVIPTKEGIPIIVIPEKVGITILVPDTCHSCESRNPYY